MTARQVTVLLLLALTWGGSFLFIRVLIDGGVGAAGVSAGRCTLGALALVPLAIATRSSFPRDFRTLAAIGALALVNMAIPWTLFAVAESHVPTGVASVGNSSTPLWAALAAIVLLKTEGLSRTQQAGLALGFAGVVALSADGLRGFDSESALGTLMVATATFCYGISGVSIRRWMGQVPAITLAIGQLGMAAVVLWPLAFATGAYEGAAMGTAEWASLVTLGVAGSGLAVAAYVWLIGEVGAVRASVVTYMMPPIGVLLGWLVLSERIGWNLVVGLAFVVGGVALVQGWALHRLAWRALAPLRRAPLPESE